MKGKGTFNFQDCDIEKYKVHGIVHARIGEMIEVPLCECVVDTTPLNKDSKPAYIWSSRAPRAPTVIIASKNTRSIPEGALSLDANKELVAIRVQIWHKGVQGQDEYGQFEITPVYRNGNG